MLLNFINHASCPTTNMDGITMMKNNCIRYNAVAFLCLVLFSMKN